MVAVETKSITGDWDRRAATQSSELTNAPLLCIFLTTIFLPMMFHVADFALSPNRIFLLVASIPLGLTILSGKCGRVTLVDILMIGFGFWMIIALAKVHGTARIAFAGITAVEAVGGYLVGRVLVRNAADYRLVFTFVCGAIIALLPFTIYENLTAKMLIPDFVANVLKLETVTRHQSAYGRMGLERVYTVFEHPILWGLFCAITVANVVMMVRKRWLLALVLPIMVYSSFSALSAAPLLAIALQVMILAWGFLTHSKWKLLIILSVVLYILIDVSSNRTPVTIIIDTLTFNKHSAWTRVTIFEYGWAAVQRNPIFGVGFSGYPRPHWLTKSVDNFWLLMAIRFGKVGLLLLLSSFLIHLWKAMMAPISNPEVRRLREGHLIALVGLILVMATVYIWTTVLVFVMFYLGSGAWLYANAPKATIQRADTSRGGMHFTRFAPVPKDQAADTAASGQFQRTPEALSVPTTKARRPLDRILDRAFGRRQKGDVTRSQTSSHHYTRK